MRNFDFIMTWIREKIFSAIIYAVWWYECTNSYLPVHATCHTNLSLISSTFSPMSTLHFDFPPTIHPFRRLGSVIGIATGYRLDGPEIESRWGTRFSGPVQTGPGAHPASCTMGTGSFPGVKSSWGVMLTPHPRSSAVGHERVELYLYSPYGLYSLYRASVPVQGWPLPFLSTPSINSKITARLEHSSHYRQHFWHLLFSG